MEVDAGRCAAVGPSGPGGFERRSTHCVHKLLSIAQRREHAQEHFFHAEPAKCLRRCQAQGAHVRGAFPLLARCKQARTSRGRWPQRRGYPPFERIPPAEHDRINKHHDRFSSPFGCILPIFREYPASRTRFFSHLWDANPGRWNQGRKCKGVESADPSALPVCT